jgi:anaerobic magnesium-protoporphyrin IX monomethyl ester cyclase
MRLILVGADYEENLGMCMIAAAAEAAGHHTEVVAFPDGEHREETVRRIVDARPDVVGLAAQFQHRGLEYLSLASELRGAGFRGHITAGGQFATMAAAPILAGRFGVDSIVLYEGERTIVELLAAIADRRALTRVAGLALPDGKGGALRTATRSLAEELDALPLAHRYRQHSRQLGVPFIPVSGSRGCWAACSFCSITSVLRDGREHGVRGRRLRLRSPHDVGLEMAMLAEAVGGSAVFCFHDENLLLPSPEKTRERIGAIRKALDEQGVARAALVGKCRPDTVTPDLARDLAAMGVIRMYVGIENTSANGAAHLNRGTDVATMSAALEAFAEAGIFVCYNLLVFEPETTLADVEANLAFMRKHAGTPVNFCRAEPYLGTPMHRRLSAAGKLRGGFLGCDYRIEDDRAELLFRIAGSAFREHNFAAEGVANRYMSLGYSAKLLEYFYKDAAGKHAALMERAREITRSITLDTADLFEQAYDIAATSDLADHDRISRLTARLGLRVAASDRIWHAALDALERDMAIFARGEAQAAKRSGGTVARAAQGAAMAGWLALWATGCGRTVDPLPPPDYGKDAGNKDSATKSDIIIVADMLPSDAPARDVADDPGRDGLVDRISVVDDVPSPLDARDLATEPPLVADMVPPPTDARDVRTVEVDPLPPPSDARDQGRPEVDAAPWDAGAYDTGADVRDASPNEPPFIVDPVVDARLGVSNEPWATREHWALATPTRLKRSPDLPLCLCPEVKLAGAWEAGQVRVTLRGPTGAFATRWQAQGTIAGAGSEVVWTPSSDEDQLDVAVRTQDGVAIALLRLEQVAGRRPA